jgi:ubiquinone biosynthesis protein
MFSIRKIGAFGRTYRHLNRYRQILGVLIAYGFGDLIDRLNIEHYLDLGRQMLSRRPPPEHVTHRQSRGHRFRMALEDLGPTYIKLGQFLSTRSDLLPADLGAELGFLQDQVASMSEAEVLRVFKQEFDRAPDALFAVFHLEAIASASIGQVHRAVLENGDLVAVKVQRPGIRRTIEVDLEIMLHLATLAERNIEEVAVHGPVRFVEEFARAMEREVDYTVEAAHMDRVARQFRDDPTVRIPRGYRELSTDRILTMEFMEGIKIDRAEELRAAGMDPARVVRRGAALFLSMVFDHGFFHADPHPGNIRVLPGEVIALLDFGLMGAIERRTKQDAVDLVYSVVRADEVAATATLLRLTEWDEEPNLRLLERDVADIMGQVFNRPLKEIEIDRLLADLLETAARYQLRLPPDFFLMVKVLATIDGIARRLDPEFDMVAQATPFIRRERMARYDPRRVAGSMASLSGEIYDFLHRFPRDALDVVRLIKRQRLTMRFEHKGLEELMETHDRISNKISFAIIIAALIIGSSIVIIAEIPPLIHGISLVGILVFTAAVVMGVWLLVAILRTGRF